MKFFQKYSITLLILLILIEAAFAGYTYFDALGESQLYHMVESSVMVIILFFTIVVTKQLHNYKEQLLKSDTLNKSSPICRVFITKNATNQIIVDEHCRVKLGLPLKDLYTLEDFCRYYSDLQWQELLAVLDKPQNFKSFKQEYEISLEKPERGQVYIGCTAHSVYDQKHKIAGLGLWFYDITERKTSEIELVHLVKKYRFNSFELDLILNELPFAVWKTDVSRNIILMNKTAQELMHKFSYQNISEFEEYIKSKPYEHRKIIFHNNQSEIYNIANYEVQNGLGYIGIAINNNETENATRLLKSLSDTFDSVLELSSNAILILDSEKKVKTYNQALINLFSISEEWMSSGQTFLSFLDKLREQKKLPEIKDYKIYRDEQLALISESTSPIHEFLHLPSSETLRMSIIPSRSGDTILMYDNISDDLSMERSFNELLSVFQETISNIRQAIVIIGQNGCLKYYNHAFLKFWNWEEAILKSDVHFDDMLKNFAPAIGQKITNDIHSKLISCLELRKNYDLKLPKVDNKDFQVTIKSLPDYSALIVISYS